MIFSLIIGVDILPGDVVLAGFAPVLWPAGSDNMGGYKGRVVFIPETAVRSVPLLPIIRVATADYVTAAGAFEFISESDKPIPIYATRSSVSYKAEPQGELDCKSFKLSGEFFHPGKRVEAAAFARQVCNTAGYLIIEDGENQQLIGQPGFPCVISSGFDGGKAAPDKRGWSFTYEADSVAPMIILGTPIDLDALFIPSSVVEPEGGA